MMYYYSGSDLKNPVRKKKPHGFFVDEDSNVVMHEGCFPDILLKQHDDSPDSAEPDENVQDDRHDRAGTEDPCDKVEIEDADKQPVQCAYDHQD
jgi:hypothetical protein